LAGRADRGIIGVWGFDGASCSTKVCHRRLRVGGATHRGDEPTIPQAGRREGSQTGRLGLFGPAGGTRVLDDAVAGRQTGGVGSRRHDRPRGRAHDAEKNAIQPWRKEQWVLPPEQNAEFVCAMEDVLEVYQRPYDPRRPVFCFDEQSKQLIRETRIPVPAAPGRPERVDYEYERNGRCWPRPANR
jgi:hypothetical protein